MGRNKTKVVVSNFYDPFGTSTSKTEAVSNPWQFASGYLDANTGLYKFGERYYDPTLGRWTQKDSVGGSVGNVNSTNPYVYADNLPNMLVDPSGRDVTAQALCVFTAVGTFLTGAAGVFGTVSGAFGLIGATGAAAAAASTSLVSGIIGILGAIVGIELTLLACGVTIEQQVAVSLEVAQLALHTLH